MHRIADMRANEKLFRVFQTREEWDYYSFKILAEKLKYCYESGKGRFDSSQDCSLFILAANHNLRWYIGTKLLFQRKHLFCRRIHSKVHVIMVLMSSLETTFHCYTTGERRNLRWHFNLSFEKENSVLIEISY